MICRVWSTVWAGWTSVGPYWAPLRSIILTTTPGPGDPTFRHLYSTTRYDHHHKHYQCCFLWCRQSPTRILSTLLVARWQLESQRTPGCSTSHLRQTPGLRAGQSRLRHSGSSSRQLPLQRINYFANKLNLYNAMYILFINRISSSGPRKSGDMLNII